MDGSWERTHLIGAGRGALESLSLRSERSLDAAVPHPGRPGDAGYQGVGKREENRDAEGDWEVAMKAGKRRRLDKCGSEEAAERRKASVRAKVEHPFLDVKCRFGYAKVRYRGLAKNTQRIAVLLGLSNLLIAGRYAIA